ncbi:MAG: hypothetical protein Kow0069_04330 [Promethearchaeota archaeon]
MLHLLQNPEVPEVYPPGYYFSADFPVWVAVVVAGVVGCALFLLKRRKLELKTQKALYLGMGMVLLFLSVMRVFYLAAVRFYVDYDLVANLGYASQLVALTALLFEFEKHVVQRTRFAFTLLGVAGVVVSLASLVDWLDRDFARLFSTLVSTLDTLAVLALFASLVRRSVGAVRTRTLTSFVGVVVMFVGNLIDSEMFYGFWPDMPLLLAPVLAFGGLVVVVLNHAVR